MGETNKIVRRFLSGEHLTKLAGEGSRGGKVIGHTRSGRPIYARPSGAMTERLGYGMDDHKDASRWHRALYEKHHAAAFAAEESASSDDVAPNLEAELTHMAGRHRKRAKRHEKASDWHDDQHTAALDAEDAGINDPSKARTREQRRT